MSEIYYEGEADGKEVKCCEETITSGELISKVAEDNAENCSCNIIKDNRGIGVVEIVLILVVLVALVIIFKDKIMEIISSAFDSITSGASSL